MAQTILAQSRTFSLGRNLETRSSFPSSEKVEDPMQLQGDIPPVVVLIADLVEQNAKLKRALAALESINSIIRGPIAAQPRKGKQISNLFSEISSTALAIANILRLLEALSVNLEAIPEGMQVAIKLAERTKGLSLDHRSSMAGSDLPCATIIPFPQR